jgi:hypothetical protein
MAETVSAPRALKSGYPEATLRATTMKAFLKEYWLWIVIPFVVVVGGLMLLFFLMSGDEGASPFVYNIY